MNSKIYFVFFATILGMFGPIGNVFPNGINPPRTSSATTLTATCTKTSGGDELVILRARVAAGERYVDMIKFGSGDTTEEVKITDIRSIVMSGKEDSRGYIKATLVRSDGTDEQAVKMQVRSNGKALTLKGFKNNRSRISIGLNKCKSITFSTADTQGNGSMKLLRKN